MNNGCICCTVRGDLIRILAGLMKRKDFDGILIETTGMADPAPVAQTFYVDQDVAEKTRLDAIVTVVDAVNLSTHLDEAHEAAEQIAFADIILLNKVDLVDAAAVATAEARIKSINPYAKIVKTEKCGVALDQVLGLDAFSLERVLEIEPDFLDESLTHEHEEDITSASLSSDTPLDEEKFQAWFGKLLRECGQDILRSKGILDFAGQDERFVVHAVHMLTDGSPLGPWPEGKPRGSKLVFIGRDLDKMGLAEGFATCKAA